MENPNTEKQEKSNMLQDNSDAAKKQMANYWRILMLCFAVVSLLTSIFSFFLLTTAVNTMASITPSAEAYNNSLVPQLVSLSSGETALSDNTAQEFAEDANLVIVGESGELLLTADSTLPLVSDSGNGIVIPLSEFGEENHTVKYNYKANCVQIDEYIISINDAAFDGEKMTEYSSDETHITTGIIGIDNYNVLISVNGSIEDTGSKIAQILNSIVPYSGTVSASIMGETINTTWLTDFEFDKEVASFSNGTDTIYLAWYDGNYKNAGFDQSIQIGKTLSAKYSEIKDSSTEFIPYMVETGAGTLKFLATSNDVLNELFQK